MEKKYKISEIAKMFNVTRTSLIHYDHYNLLKPSLRTDNNYRMYSINDIKKLELIIALKESGLQLSEIRDYLDNKNNQTSIELLVTQEKLINQKIKELTKQRTVIKKRIKHLEEFSKVDIYKGIKEVSYPSKKISFEEIGFGPLMNYSSALNRLISRFPDSSQLSSKFGTCYEINESKSLSINEKYVFDYFNIDEHENKTKEIDEGSFLACIHYGERSNAIETVKEMVSYAQSKGLMIESELYYIPLFDYWESTIDEFISEILIRIKHVK